MSPRHASMLTSMKAPASSGTCSVLRVAPFTTGIDVPGPNPGTVFTPGGVCTSLHVVHADVIAGAVPVPVPVGPVGEGASVVTVSVSWLVRRPPVISGVFDGPLGVNSGVPGVSESGGGTLAVVVRVTTVVTPLAVVVSVVVTVCMLGS